MQLAQMDDRVSVSRDWFKDYNFHLITNAEKVGQLVDICIKRGTCSLDLETTGVDNRVYPDEYFEDGVVTKFGIRTVDRIVGVCISFDGQNGYYIPLFHEPTDSPNCPWDETWDHIERLCNSCRIIFHNSKFDQEFLYPVIGKERWKPAEFEDTYFIAKVISPLKSNPAGLKPLTKIHYGVEMVELDELFTAEKKEQLVRQKMGKNFSLLHPKEGLEYGCSDGIFTYKLYFTLIEKLGESDNFMYSMEKKFCNVIRKMERNRVHLDVNRVTALYEECKFALREVGDSIRDYVERMTGNTGKWRTLNIGSPSQLSRALFTDPEGMKLKPTPEMTENGEGGYSVTYDDNFDEDDDDSGSEKEIQYSLKDEILKSLHRHYGQKLVIKRESHEKTESIFELILEYRHYDKMKGSYIEKLFKSHDKYGDVRPNFNQLGTDTTRLSSKAGKIEDGYSGINFQGIPRVSDDDKPALFKEIRSCIAPRSGYILLKMDYAGEELRVVTNLSGDPLWTEEFLMRDGDVHSITTRILFQKQNISKDERNRGKRCNFAFIYGGGAGAIQRNIGCSMEDAQRYMNNLKEGVPILMGYVEHQKSFARKHKCIYTAFGRRIPIPTIDSPIKGIRKKAERCAINYTIQATSADILKLAMINLDNHIVARGWEEKVRYVLTVHDEVVFEIRPDIMMEAIPLLNEWMVMPWKLRKAHGRDWVVPLETEPEVDIHWKARYDFFAMTMGTPADPDKFENGKYTGKLKDGQYIADGRIYQKIPEFLSEHVRRYPLIDGKPQTDALDSLIEGEVQENASEPEKKPAELPPSNTPALPEKPEEKPTEPEEKPTEPEEKPTEPEEKPTEPEEKPTETIQDSEIESPSSETKLETQKKPSFDFNLDSSSDMGVDVNDSSNDEVSEEESPNLSMENIFRWEFKAVPSERNLRKFHAICILAEGETPIRVIGSKGQVLIKENPKLGVDINKFKLLTDLFGLD